ncbi:synaptonemal complex central element protein 1-like [Phascolarctos cinereus]|uniref:Synaptonemal complex central element protein 1-like n=1 Tax=Phascolarctos cinereus TaxID=38626 RepID=A0A6P5JWA0_PHACI|nr:synaptonemal complex central element protein 1-like [Phascolarctos cinereus]
MENFDKPVWIPEKNVWACITSHSPDAEYEDSGKVQKEPIYSEESPSHIGSKGNLDPRTEDVISRINELQQAKKIANKELCETQAHRQSLQKELDEMSLEETQLKEILSKKQETLRILRLHCQEKETEVVRQQAVFEGYQKRITELNSKIQEGKLKKRNQRMEFGQQLEEMMEKNKTVWEFHKTAKLSQEISKVNNNKEQLLIEERLTQEKLDSIQKQLDRLTQPEAKTEATAVTSVDAFLCSEEAAAAMQASQLFEEENKKATESLKAASLHYHQLQQKYQRLKRELESVGHSSIRGSKETGTEEAAEWESGIVTKSVMELPRTQKKDQEVRPDPGKHHEVHLHPRGSQREQQNKGYDDHTTQALPALIVHVSNPLRDLCRDAVSAPQDVWIQQSTPKGNPSVLLLLCNESNLFP